MLKLKRYEDGLAPNMLPKKLLSDPRGWKARELGHPARIILRKEVIQPQVPLRLPCYDFTPVAELTVAGCPP